MDYKINGNYKVTQPQEFGVDFNGCRYLVIYGQHINGGFIAVPNWNFCTEAGEPEDINYNAEKLYKAFGYEGAKTIASAVREHWRSVSKTAEGPAEVKDELAAKKITEDKFTAKKSGFDGEPGYMVAQIHDGKKVVEQFVPESVYKDFCEVIGVEPEIIGEQPGGSQKAHKLEPDRERER